MAEKKKSTAKKTDASAVKKKDAVEQPAVAQPVVPVVKDIDVHQFITVRNGFQGMLVYISKRTGEVFEWDEFGSEQEIELQELRNAKSSAKKFFINNWFMFNDEDRWVVDYLGVGQYYRYALGVENFDDLFSKTPAEIEKVLSKLSKGQKRSVGYRAMQLIRDGKIDSIKAITALENALGVELIEH